MTKQIGLFVILLFCALPSFAQTPKSITHGSINFNAPLQLLNDACADQNAGTIDMISSIVAESNDVDLDTAYLCMNDSFNLIHNGNFDLTGDPQIATAPGVTYAFYECPPTVTGPDLTTILANEPCFILTPPPSTGNFYTSFEGTADGNAPFFNTGGLQTFFNSGDPILLWFAPITIDDFSSRGYEDDGAGGIEGPCVNVSVSEAFAVVYLNEIQTGSINVGGGGTACGATFTLTGGLPEFDGSNYNNISITLNGNPGVTGSLVGNLPSNGGTIEFTVPEAGMYDVVVEDGKSCPLSFQVDISNCGNAVSFTIPTVTASTGQSVCLPISVENFTDILTMQFSINYDEAILQYDSLTAFGLPNLSLGSSFGTPPALPDGQITTSWNDALPFDGESVPDNSVIFEVCFTMIGSMCDFGFVTINDNPLTAEVTNEVGAILGINIDDGGVLNPCGFTVDVQTDSVSCNGLTDGGFTVTASGELPPYSVDWESIPAGLSGSDVVAIEGGSVSFSNLPAGGYSVTVADASVPATDTVIIFSIGEPLLLGVGPAIVNPLCNGDSTGQFNIVVMGGVMPYSYLWSNDDTTPNLLDIPAGPYGVTVTDAKGCTEEASGALFEPASITTVVNGTDATCSGTMDGSAEAIAIGGTEDFTYEWSTTPVQTNAIANGLDVGQYFVTITDTNGCVAVDSVDISAATILLANATLQDVNCFGESNGSISLSPSAIGTENGGYTFNWMPAVAGMNDNNANTLGAGDYNVIITDAAGCFIDSVFTIAEPDAMAIMITNLMNESCTVGGDATVTVEAQGGNGGFMYDWPTQSGPTATNLTAGTYTVTVSDMGGCVDSLEVVIGVPQGPIINSFQVTDLQCASDTNGSISVSATDTNFPITDYSWSNNESGAALTTINNLSPGTYFVTVTNSEGCFSIDSATVISPLPLVISDTTLNLPFCPEQSSGSIAVSVEGGTMPYTFGWSTGAMVEEVLPNIMGDNTYFLTITDGNNCPDLIAEFFLPDPPSINIDFMAIDSVNCNGGIPCDGTATALASGGTAGGTSFTFQWASGETDTGVTTSVASELCQGWQVLTVFDADCPAVDSVFIEAPAPLSSGPLTMGNSPTCNGDSDGFAVVQGIGGTAPYTYNWQGGTAGDILNNVSAGTYDVTINDANACSFSLDVTITEPAPFVAMVDFLNTSDISCNGESDGQVSVTWTGGNPGANTFEWSNNVSFSETASNLPVGLYSVTVTDPNGCTTETEHFVSEPPPVIAQLDTIATIECAGGATAISIVAASGGSGAPYKFSIGQNGNRQLVGFSIPNVPAGDYDIYVFDSLDCFTILPLEITEPDAIAPSLGPDIEVELGDSTELQLTLAPGVMLDTIIWSPNSAITCLDTLCYTVNIQPLEAQIFSVTVFDENGCFGTDDIFVDVDKNRNVWIPSIFSPNEDGVNDNFEIFTGPGVEEIRSVLIFDRWGEQVFDAQNLDPSSFGIKLWDGRLDGKFMNPGVFVYIIEVSFVDNLDLTYKGDITIIR